MRPLAAEVPLQKRQSTLQGLLARIQAARGGTRSAPIAKVVSKPATPALAKPVAPAPAAPEKIDAFDDRWSTPQKPPPAAAAPEKIDAFDDRWSTPQKPPPAAPAAPEKIDAFDDRWSTPQRPPLQVVPPAKTAAPAQAVSGDRAARLKALLDRVLKNGRR